MFRVSVLAALLASAAGVAHGSTQVAVDNMTCAGNLSISVDDSLRLVCRGGDFSLSGGRIASDADVFIDAPEGALLLDNLAIEAVRVSLQSFGPLNVHSNVSITAYGSSVLQPAAGSVILVSGRDIGLASAAPASAVLSARQTRGGQLVLRNSNGIILASDALTLTPSIASTIIAGESQFAVPEAGTLGSMLLGLSLSMLCLHLKQRRSA